MPAKRSCGAIKLFGEYYVKLDEDFRLLLPRLFKEFISGDEVIIISIDCIEHPRTLSFQNLMFIRSRDLSDWRGQELQRYEIDWKTKEVVATYVKARLDKRGRITIPAQFRRKIPRQAVLIGVRDHFELWPERAWEKYMSDAEPDSADSLRDEYGF